MKAYRKACKLGSIKKMKGLRERRLKSLKKNK